MLYVCTYTVLSVSCLMQESKLKEEPEHVPEPVPEAEPKEVSESAAVQEPEKEPQLESTTVTDCNESPKEQVHMYTCY